MNEFFEYLSNGNNVITALSFIIILYKSLKKIPFVVFQSP